MPSLYEHAGGEEAIRRLEEAFYRKVLADMVLKPLFGEGRPTHVDRLTAFTAESFGADLAVNSPAYSRNRDVRKTPSGNASTWPAFQRRGGAARSRAEKRSASSVWHNAAYRRWDGRGRI